MSKECYNCFKDEKIYQGKDGNMKEGTFSNVYFHLSYFITSLVFCPDDDSMIHCTDLKGHLRPEHRECLSAASIKFKLHVVLVWSKKKTNVCFNVTEQRFINCLKFV